jgi:glucose-1-phosphate thymidylyltransferase
MEAIILAAGYGTRLYPLTRDVSKSLLPLGQRCILDFLVEKVRQLKVNRITIVTNNKFYQDFRDWEQGQNFPLTILNDQTKTPEERLGAVGDIEFALKEINKEDDFLVLGGDNLFDWDLRVFSDFAGKVDNPVVGLYDIKDLEKARRFGIAEIDAENRIIDFQEKPDNPKSTLAAACLYFFPAKDVKFVYNYVVERKDNDTTGDYICWLKDRAEVYGCVFQGVWLDVGHKDTLKQAEQLFGKKQR